MKLIIDELNEGERIDSFLSGILPEFSRSKIQNLIKSNKCLVNYKPVKSSYLLKVEDIIVVEESTAGAPAGMEIRQLPESGGSLVVEINHKKVHLPKFASVNGKLESEYYSIQDGDEIEFLKYYTIEQILQFMDIQSDTYNTYYVNNNSAGMDTKVYENFTVVMSKTEMVTSYEDLLKEVTIGV